ncbi:MAG: ATP-binding protein [Lachnospiraceae bacterium]|nr:ATP-binding protein [Lachnospiraceae bacterium]
MVKDFYLLSITTSGIKNIEKEVTLNFYKKGVDKDFDPEKYRVKAIYGENGSGKSALMTAVSIFKNLILDEDYLMNPENQRLLRELINKKKNCFRFQCEFLNDDGGNYSIYRYSVELKGNDIEKYHITRESLEIKSGNYAQSKYRDLYIVEDGVLKYIEATDSVKKVINGISVNLLDSRTLITIYMRKINDVLFDEKSMELKWAMSLCSVLAMVIKVHLAGEDRHELYFVQKSLKDDLSKGIQSDSFLSHFNKCILEYSSVNEIYVSKKNYEKYKGRIEDLTEFIKLFKKDLKNIDIDRKEDRDYFRCELVFNYGEYNISKEFESTGIKKLVELYDYLDAAGRGGIVFIDEMDSNLNDIYLCKMIEYFVYYGKGQLCFTTHNIDPMNVLKGNKKSIDFLSTDNILVPWTSNGNAMPDNNYRNGYIENLPFNIDSTDFLGVLGVD